MHTATAANNNGIHAASNRRRPACAHEQREDIAATHRASKGVGKIASHADQQAWEAVSHTRMGQRRGRLVHVRRVVVVLVVVGGGVDGQRGLRPFRLTPPNPFTPFT
jgi:hypothetical protein